MKRSRRYASVILALIPMAASLTLIAASDPLVVRMQGPCDPATFNAAVGPGTCVGDGTKGGLQSALAKTANSK